jgi:hypothetical protein
MRFKQNKTHISYAHILYDYIAFAALILLTELHLRILVSHKTK